MIHPLKGLFTALILVISPGLLSALEADDEGVWVDVRSSQEYRQGHIEGAINIFHGDIGHKIIAAVPDLGTPVHLYGATGVYAGLALEILMEMGFEYVVNEGSYEAIRQRQTDE